jgi:hypothetical protein
MRLSKLFTEQDSVDAMFYSSNSGGESSTKSKMEVKKKKAEQIVELKKKSQCRKWRVLYQRRTCS